jgi:hypothetical protein
MLLLIQLWLVGIILATGQCERELQAFIRASLEQAAAVLVRGSNPVC